MSKKTSNTKKIKFNLYYVLIDFSCGELKNHQELSSAFKKEKFQGFEIFDTTNTLKDIKKRISEKTNLPIGAILGFALEEKNNETNEKRLNYYEQDENTMIKDTQISGKYISNIVYFVVDLSSPELNIYNNSQNILEMKDQILNIEDSLEKKNKEFKDEIDKTINSNQKKILSFNQKFKSYDEKINKIDNLKEEFTSFNSKLDDKISSTELNNTAIDLQSKIDDITSQLIYKTSYSELKELEIKIKDVKEELSYKSSYSYLDIKVSDVEKKINDVKSDLSTKISNSNSELNKKVSELQTSLDTKINKVQSDLSSKISDFNSKTSGFQLNIDKRINEVQSNLDKRINEVQSNLEKRINEVQSNLEKKIKENYDIIKEDFNKNILSLQDQINSLNSKIKKEEDKKNETEQKEINCKNELENNQREIKEKIIEKTKNLISKLKIDFLKEIESKEIKNNFFIISLKKYMKKFTENFLKLKPNFLESLDYEVEKLLDTYNINPNKPTITHINFIVIGEAGVGKSTLVNEVLHLEGDSKAEEGIIESTTLESKQYSSDKLKMIKMYDTKGLKIGENIIILLNEVNKLINEKDNKNNVVLYCTKAKRFEKEEAEYIKSIMSTYPNFDLPVIITVLQLYNTKKEKEIEEGIKKVLLKYLNDEELVKKIKIKFVISRDEDREENPMKAKGINELLKTAFDIKKEVIISERLQIFNREKTNFEKEKIEKRLNEIKDKIFYDELLYIQSILSSNSFNYFDENENINEKQIFQIKDNFKMHLKNKIKEVYFFLNNNNKDNEKDMNKFIEKELNIIEKEKNQHFNFIYQLLDDLSSSFFFINLKKEQIRLNQRYNTKNEINSIGGIELKKCFYNDFDIIMACSIIKLIYDNIREVTLENIQSKFNNDIIYNKKEYFQKEIENLENEFLAGVKAKK